MRKDGGGSVVVLCHLIVRCFFKSGKAELTSVKCCYVMKAFSASYKQQQPESAFTGDESEILLQVLLIFR